MVVELKIYYTEASVNIAKYIILIIIIIINNKTTVYEERIQRNSSDL